jgi:hypothetical protein
LRTANAPWTIEVRKWEPINLLEKAKQKK